MLRVSSLLLCFGLGLAVFAQLGCAASPSAGERVDPAAKQLYASALARRLARVEVGQSAESVRALIGTPPVRRPGSEGEAFPSPLKRLALLTPEGRAVELELYVVSASRGEGCPDVHLELLPVVYLDGEVRGLDWDYVEANWRNWGGSLASLREARGVHGCPFAPPSPEA